MLSGTETARMLIINVLRCFRRKTGGYVIVFCLAGGFIMISLMTPQNSKFSQSNDRITADSNPVPIYQRWYLSNKTAYSSIPVPQENICHVWPHQLPASDRIEHQLLFQPKVVPKHTKLILLYGTHERRTRPAIGQSVFLNNHCPVKHCTITYHKTKLKTADAVIFKDAVPDELKQAVRPASQVWILTLLESPHHTENFLSYNDLINWTATYRQDSELVTPYEKFVLYHPNILSKNQSVDYAKQKTGRGKVAWFVSNCETANKRMEYAKELQKFINVDIIGKCGPNVCSREKFGTCVEILKKNYKFYLSFENSNCRWYITEKLWSALASDVVPITMGAPLEDYAAVAPHNSFIHVDSFASPEQLASYLHYLDQNDTAYNSYFQWKGTGELINTQYYCRLCALLHANGPRKSYANLNKWWQGAGVCSDAPSDNPIVNDF